MSDRFDLEQQILGCWTMVDDLKFYLDKSDTWTEDERMNYLIGMKVKYDKKFEEMFDTFSDCVHNDTFTPTEHIDITHNFDGLESAYDNPFDMSLQHLNDGYNPRD